jgi:hypothetical protein
MSPGTIHFCIVGSAVQLLVACAALDAHENFKRAMQRQVGRSTDDGDIFWNRYPQDRGAINDLNDGRLQYELRFAPTCTVYFIVDKVTNKIVDWRYEGPKRTCKIVP